MTILIFIFSFNHCGFISEKKQAKHLKSLAKLHGLVRFFHPSHENTTINWNKHLIYSIKEIRKVKSQTGLKQSFEQLFSPVAPSMALLWEGKQPPVLPEIEETEKKELYTWAHTNGVDLSEDVKFTRSRRSGYVTRNVSSAYQMLQQSVKKGQHYVLKLNLKISAPDSTFLGKGLIQINGHKHEYEFIPHDWKTIELSGTFEKDANETFVIFRLIPNKVINILLDDIELYISPDKQQWTPSSIYNHNFEIQDSIPKGWELHSGSYSIFASGFIDSTNYALELKQQKNNWRFSHPYYGEVTTQSISEDINCWIPLALYGNIDSTFTASSSYSLEQLQAKIYPIILRELKREDQNVQIANVILIWNVFQHFCPDLKDKKAWELELDKALLAILENQKPIQDIYDEMLFATGSPMNFLDNKILELEKGYIPISFQKLDDNNIYTVYSDDDQVLVGDQLLSIDGISIDKIINKNSQNIAGSAAWKKVHTEFSLSRDDINTSKTFTFLRENKEVDIELTYSIPTPFLLSNIRPSFEEKEKGVYYLNLSTMTIGEFNHHLSKLKKAKAIIFDLRGGFNVKPNKLLQHLTKDSFDYPAYRFADIHYPDNERDSIVQQNFKPVMAEAPYLPAQKIFLVDNYSKRFCELLIRLVRKYELGIVIGQKTNGLSGIKKTVKLLGNYELSWSDLKELNYENREVNDGHKPDILVKSDLKRIKEEGDIILSEALKYLKGKKILSSKDLAQ